MVVNCLLCDWCRGRVVRWVSLITVSYCCAANRSAAACAICPSPLAGERAGTFAGTPSPGDIAGAIASGGRGGGGGGGAKFTGCMSSCSKQEVSRSVHVFLFKTELLIKNSKSSEECPFLKKLKRIRKQKKFYFVFPFLPRLTRLLIMNLVSIGYVLSLKLHDTCLIFRVRKRSYEVYGKHVIRNICIEKSSEGIRKEKSQQ
jgi:hypothetical protein